MIISKEKKKKIIILKYIVLKIFILAVEEWNFRERGMAQITCPVVARESLNDH